jgi:uncharacterized protein (TIGR02271 family)
MSRRSRAKRGGVTVSKRVFEDTNSIEVPVRREEVYVERRPVSDASATAHVGNDAFTEERILGPVMKEEVEVRKVARPVEEIEITKTAAGTRDASTRQFGAQSSISTTRLDTLIGNVIPGRAPEWCRSRAPTATRNGFLGRRKDAT